MKIETTWYLQYFRFEDIYYLAELHDEDGIITELFFDTKTEIVDYIKNNNILIKEEQYTI